MRESRLRPGKYVLRFNLLPNGKPDPGSWVFAREDRKSPSSTDLIPIPIRTVEAAAIAIRFSDGREEQFLMPEPPK